MPNAAATCESAALRLRIYRRDSEMWLQAERGDDELLTPPLKLPHNAVAAARGSATKLLDFRQKIKGIEPGDVAAVQAFQVLYENGVHFALGLIGGRTNFRLLREACSRALGPPRSALEDAPPVVEVDGPSDFLFPFEFLPLAGRRPESPEGDVLEAWGRAFLGFCAVIRRVPRAPFRQPPQLEYTYGSLPVSLICNSGLEGARQEQAFFNEEQEVELQVVWPEALLDTDAVVKKLGQRLLNPRWLDATQRSARPDQVQHFACHCLTEGDTHEWKLRLKHHSGESVDVRLSALETELVDLPDATEPLPLVFLNACGSGTVDPFSATSFVSLFLDQPNGRGFIGTETRVPDSFACKFSRRFYRELLGGASVGTALHRTRWSLLLRQRNPLGILYVLYGDPDLGVRKAPAERSAA